MSTIETKQNEANEYKHSLCRSWPFGRNSRIGLGALLVIIGLIWLGARTGYIPVEWFHSEFFWPAVVILIGVWIVVKSIIRRKHHRG